MRIPKKPRRNYVARLCYKEHDLLRDLRKLGGTQDRYDALLQLIPYAQALTVEDFPIEPLDPIRLMIPLKLDEVLKDKSAELERPFIRCLVVAAQKWLADRSPPDWVI